MAFTLRSSIFQPERRIPPRYTADGLNISPPLHWLDVPEGTRELALICDDPDAPAGAWVHWVAWGISPKLNQLPEGVSQHPNLANGMHQGVNDFHRLGYGGPAPLRGTAHHYNFTLYALDAPVSLAENASKKELLKQMRGHILGKTRLTGLYKR